MSITKELIVEQLGIIKNNNPSKYIETLRWMHEQDTTPCCNIPDGVNCSNLSCAECSLHNIRYHQTKKIINNDVEIIHTTLLLEG